MKDELNDSLFWHDNEVIYKKRLRGFVIIINSYRL